MTSTNHSNPNTGAAIAASVARMAEGQSFNASTLIAAHSLLLRLSERASFAAAAVAARLDGTHDAVALADAAELLAATSEPEPPKSWRDPADAVSNMRRVVDLDAQDMSVLDEPMLCVVAELTGQLPAVLATLDTASVACAALENIMLDPKVRNAMTPGDQQGRDKLADELRAQLTAIGA